MADVGYDAPRLAFLLRDLAMQVLARMRSDRVLRRAVPPRFRRDQHLMRTGHAVDDDRVEPRQPLG
nr:hypothetical protein [Micromonospora sp. A200]